MLFFSKKFHIVILKLSTQSSRCHPCQRDRLLHITFYLAPNGNFAKKEISIIQHGFIVWGQFWPLGCGGLYKKVFYMYCTVYNLYSTIFRSVLGCKQGFNPMILHMCVLNINLSFLICKKIEFNYFYLTVQALIYDEKRNNLALSFTLLPCHWHINITFFSGKRLRRALT